MVYCNWFDVLRYGNNSFNPTIINLGARICTGLSLVNGEVTNEKVSMGMLAFGIFMVALGFRKHEQKR